MPSVVVDKITNIMKLIYEQIKNEYLDITKIVIKSKTQ